ncbi:MAG: DEAD/DEAH box helicase [Planctomycetes bacterium]|nr:DEAD/DEAH box helicase [Planctomycetota bacterium]
MTPTRHQLRDYQETAVAGVVRALGNRPILVAPTGSGKTVMATALVERIGGHVLWMAHRKELIEQAAARLQSHGLVVGVIKAGVRPTPLAPVQVASVASLLRRDFPPAELIVIDEAHHAAADSYRTILEGYASVPLVGLTATPFRLDGRGLGDLFGEIVVAAWPDELCSRGILHKPKVWASPPPDLRGVRVVAGDYNKSQLAQRVNTREQNADLVKMWLKHAAGRRTVAFAVDVEHSQAIVAAFRGVGLPAEHLDGKTHECERAAILERLASGRTLIVSNCMVLTEGWDLPVLECAIVARPTDSLNLHLQMVGRIMRACDGKDGAIVLDHAGNHHKHGLVTRRLNYTLTSQKIGSDEPLGLRRCEACGLFFALSDPCCPDCGWAPAARGAERERPEVHGDGELREFGDDDFVIQYYGPEAEFEYPFRRRVWDGIERLRGSYDPHWSRRRYVECFGAWPVVVGDELVDTASATQDQKRAVYEQLLGVARGKGYKDGWAAYRFKDTFGVWPRGFVTEIRETDFRDKVARLRA